MFFINMNSESKMNCGLNMGSICQIRKVKLLHLACNQYQYETDIEAGVKVVIREDSYSGSWDNFNSEYVNSNDTYISAYCRKVGVFEYEDTDFPNNSYVDTEYVIVRIIDIDDDIYVDKVLSDLHYQKKEAKMSSFDRTPIFAKEFYTDPYSDSLEELELELELEELEGQTGV